LLYFTQLFHPYVFGGGEYIFYLFAREFAKRGHTIHVITQRLADTVPYEEHEGIRIHRVGSEYSYRGTLPPTIRHNLDYLLNAFRKGKQVISDGKKRGNAIDIIHSNTYVPVLAGHICSKMYRIPHIVTFHDVYQASDKGFWKEWRTKQESNLPFYAPLMSKLVEDLILKLRVSAFHTVSETTREDLTSFGVNTEKIAVIPNGIEQTTNMTESEHGKFQQPTAVFVGRLVHYKNVDTVIKAFRNVIKSVPNAKLIIIGDGPYRSRLLQEAEDIKDSIEFVGRVSEAEKVRLIANSYVMVFPSLIEGFGIAIIEGFALKKPVLVSDVRPPSDIVKNDYSGFVIPPFDATAWAERIIELFTDNDKRRRMSVNAFSEFSTKYEISHVIDSMGLLYEATRLGR
jgi:glycosyltransferase involved in cell wall biosynthesis